MKKQLYLVSYALKLSIKKWYESVYEIEDVKMRRTNFGKWKRKRQPFTFETLLNMSHKSY